MMNIFSKSCCKLTLLLLIPVSCPIISQRGGAHQNRDKVNLIEINYHRKLWIHTIRLHTGWVQSMTESIQLQIGGVHVQIQTDRYIYIKTGTITDKQVQLHTYRYITYRRVQLYRNRYSYRQTGKFYRQQGILQTDMCSYI